MSIALATGTAVSSTTTKARILVVAPPQTSSEFSDHLARIGHELVEKDAPEAVSAALADGYYDLIFVDAGLLQLIPSDLGIPVIVVADEPSIHSPAGCVGVVSRSALMGSIAAIVPLVLERELLRNRCAELEMVAGGVRDGSAVVGRSPAIRRLQSALSRAADSDTTVLIEGATGTGKSLAARVVHCKSRRGNRPLMVLAGAGIDADAMADALANARGTTLVVEDVDQLPQVAQQVFVRFLKERTQAKAGEPPPTRVIATSSAHLPELVARGAFREDLYYRLHVFPIVMPTLRERTEDIAILARTLLDQCAGQGKIRPVGFTAEALAQLEAQPWPGNVAQLENVVRRAYVSAGGGPIDTAQLAPATAPVAAARPLAAPSADQSEVVTEDSIRPFEQEEQLLLTRALKATHGNVRRAAQLLGIGRATLYRKIQQYRLRLQ